MWMMMMHKLSEELKLSILEVEDFNYIGGLNWLSMFHQKEEYINSFKK